MTPEQLAADRAVCDAATPGPWVWDASEYHARMSCISGHSIGDFEGLPIGAWVDEAYLELPATDAAFIAAARTRWPAALDEIERLRAEVAAEREACAVFVENLFPVINDSGWLVQDQRRQLAAHIAAAIRDRVTAAPPPPAAAPQAPRPPD